MREPRVLWLWPELLAEIPELGGVLNTIGRVDALALNRAGILERIGDYDVLVPRLNDTVDVAVIERGQHLRIIGTPSTGTDHIDVATAERRGIRIVSIRDDRAFLDTVQATAELAWLLLMACARNFRRTTNHVLEGGWDAMAIRGHEMIGRTLGVVGHGRLGSMVSRFGRAFRMEVLAADVRPINEPGVTQVGLDELLRRSDFVSIHVHLTEQTRGMIGRREIALMKRGAVLVNTSRGDLIDEDALVAALASGHLAAAGLDVIHGERDADRNDRPLLRYAMEHENLIVTPHTGGTTFESQGKAVLHFARKLQRVWQERDAVGK